LKPLWSDAQGSFFHKNEKPLLVLPSVTGS